MFAPIRVVLLGLAVCVCQSVGIAQDASTHKVTSKKVVEQVDLSGNWSGSWLSCKNGHNGKLRATFCRLNEHQVQATFVGSFAKILPFRYNAVLQIVHEEDGVIVVRGSKRLGPIMGVFSYEATISGDRFDATYQSRRDCGRWSMTRCPESSCCK